MPAPGKLDFLALLDKVQGMKKAQWEAVGIFNVFQFSRNSHWINLGIIIMLILLWEGSTNTFDLPCGMLTPTLFDVATITSLSPLGETFDPTLSTQLKFHFNRARFKHYIRYNHVTDNLNVFNEEHVTFLTLWISYFQFCPRSLQISKSFIPLEIQIHEGPQTSLIKLLLVYLYHMLGVAASRKNDLPKNLKGPTLSSPLWLLQHWMNATFEPWLACTMSEDAKPWLNDKTIEGLRLYLITLHSRYVFIKYISCS